jgi:6-pyruvoyltetrahydropterin/6-carboxytetrahydropterin synthase
MPFELRVTGKFAAAHQLRGYKGKCEQLHGHNYRVEVELQTEDLDDIGIALDFAQIKGILDEILRALDHSFLNEVPPFDKVNPSAENIAKYIYDQMKNRIPGKASIITCTVWESDNAAASYRE